MTTQRPPLPAGQLDAAGLNRQHVFDLADLPDEVRATLNLVPGERQLILIGHGGRRLWEGVTASGIASEHPIDDYTRQTIAAWFAGEVPGGHYRLLYPGDQSIGLQNLGKLAGWHQASPFMVGVDSEWGSWYAYRAVLITDTDFCPSPAVDHSSPCPSCADQPCRAACPGQALDGPQFALDRCVAYRKQADSRCQYTCQARLRCPVAPQHRYDDAQLKHSYARSLRMIREHY